MAKTAERFRADHPHRVCIGTFYRNAPVRANFQSKYPWKTMKIDEYFIVEDWGDNNFLEFRSVAARVSSRTRYGKFSVTKIGNNQFYVTKVAEWDQKFVY